MVKTIPFYIDPSEEFPNGRETTLSVGDDVRDDLTGQINKVIYIIPIEDIKKLNDEILVYEKWKGNWVVIDNKYLDGYRYEWEVSKC